MIALQVIVFICSLLSIIVWYRRDRRPVSNQITKTIQVIRLARNHSVDWSAPTLTSLRERATMFEQAAKEIRECAAQQIKKDKNGNRD